MNEKDQKSLNKIKYGIMIVVVIFFISLIFILYQKSDHVSGLKELEQKYNYINFNYFQEAEKYYDISSNAFDLNEYNLSIKNCEIARGWYWDYSYELRKLHVELSDMVLNKELKVLYNELLLTDINITENMYEACEYFESASRNFMQKDYEEGNAEIKSMNEKIEAHDLAVRKWNDIQAQIDYQKKVA